MHQRADLCISRGVLHQSHIEVSHLSHLLIIRIFGTPDGECFRLVCLGLALTGLVAFWGFRSPSRKARVPF